MTADQHFQTCAHEMGLDFSGEIKIGGNYSPGSCDGRQLWVSGYVRSAAHFTQQSEVADGASEVLCRVLGPQGVHTRTSVGVMQLPKGASVELDMVVTAKEGRYE